ncbi:MAG TPA: translocation/assembly module TamB domain-containing protein, partial [Chlamydiales bacterium]|nr:translocation/assembly module TamB domain-containing protein [Chlamydiales bacterium]
PLKVKAFGKVDSDLKGQIETGFGTFYNHTFLLKDPCPFSFSEVGPLALSFDQGTLLCKWDYRDEKSDFTLSFSNFPLDLLSLNPLEVPITGEITSELSLHQEKRVLTGQWKALLSGFQAGTIQTSGNVTGDLEKERLLLSGHLGREGKEEIGMELSLPIRILLSPPQIEIFWNDSLTGQFFYDGNVEELLDFADLGTHHISGNCNCNLTLSDTLLHPSLKGICTFTNGLYENYLTGVKLTAIEGKGEALGDRIDIAITGRDLPSLGTFEGTGVIELKTEEKFPFLFHAQLQDFAVTQIDLVSSKATGNFTLVGNWEGAHLEGNVDLLQTELHIPSHLPNPLPELTVVYRNALKPPPIPPEKGNFIYPIALDLSLQTIHGIRIDGRGLTSEWNGAFHLGGTSANFIAEGKLDLIEGEFLFAGRSFKLTDGALSFRGKPNEVPYLNLGGLVQVKDVEISVRLKGPLNRPQVTFQSSPPLPMSSIVSYLLFGQEIAEINSFQALQLVGTIASFSGDAPDVLEETRRALGVDRLEIVSMPGPGEEEALTNTVAVQVGKYVGESVLVSYTQGAEFAAGNISIEIEIPHGLTIMLENDQKMEQGKFTLKWNYNY